MEWAIGIAAILAVGYFILGKLANSNNPKIQEMVEAGRQISSGEREPGETLEQARGRKHFEATYKYYDKIMDLQNEGKYGAALKLIEKAMAEPDFDPADDIYAMDAAECFTRMAEGKTPQAVLNFYDKLKSEGRAIAHAERHGGLAEMYSALDDAMRVYPEIKTKAALRKAMDFIRGGHPLMLAAVEQEPFTFANFLDERAENILEGWEAGENGEDLESILAGIEARM